jgi:hypothetical protein
MSERTKPDKYKKEEEEKEEQGKIRTGSMNQRKEINK